MAAGSWLQHRALSVTLFSLIPHLHQDKCTAFSAVCCKGSSLILQAVLSSKSSFVLSGFDFLGGIFLVFAIVHESLGKAKPFISCVDYLLDGQ